jgi:prepilin-type N-terminal cleavage/methylation domain-containing protein
MLLLNNRGFTLVEVMVTASILALIMAIIYGAFAGSIKSMQISTEGGDCYRKARLILNHIAEEISCAYLPTEEAISDIQYAFIGDDREEDGLPRDTLSFTSTALPVKGPPRGLKEIGYGITLDPETDEPALVMREDVTPDDHVDEGGMSYLLDADIWGLDFTFYDARGRDWERWDSTASIFAGKLPQRCRIAIYYKDEQGEPFALTTTTLIPMGGD